MKITKTTVTKVTIEYSYWFYNRTNRTVEEATDTVDEADLNRKNDDGEPYVMEMEEYIKEQQGRHAFTTKELALEFAKETLSKDLSSYQRTIQLNKEALNATIHAMGKLDEAAKVKAS